MAQFYYLRLYVNIKTLSCCLLLRMERMDMHWNLNKARPTFSRFNTMSADYHQKIIMGSAP